MKKFFFVAVAAAVVFASCQKAEQVNLNANQDEVSIIAFNKNMTKGYTGWAADKTFFEEVTDPEAESLTVTPRKMQLSVYEQGAGDLFTDVTFATADNPVTGTSIWRATPAKYYPLGGSTFDFLAYSVGKDANKIGVWDGAKKVTFQVTDAFTQDDILYAAASSTSKKEATSMSFNHAQAWVNMNLNLTKESAENVVLKVNSITWKNVQTQGKLCIEGKEGNATATWDFFGIDAKDVEMDDPAKVLEVKLKYAAAETPTKAEQTKLNMLLPAQKGATGFVINYTLGEGDAAQTFDYEYTLVSGSPAVPTPADWKMGKKYIYNILITINEITIDPSVVDFKVETTETINL